MDIDGIMLRVFEQFRGDSIHCYKVIIDQCDILLPMDFFDQAIISASAWSFVLSSRDELRQAKIHVQVREYRGEADQAEDHMVIIVYAVP